MITVTVANKYKYYILTCDAVIYFLLIIRLYCYNSHQWEDFQYWTFSNQWPAHIGVYSPQWPCDWRPAYWTICQRCWVWRIYSIHWLYLQVCRGIRHCQCSFEREWKWWMVDFLSLHWSYYCEWWGFGANIRSRYWVIAGWWWKAIVWYHSTTTHCYLHRYIYAFIYTCMYIYMYNNKFNMACMLCI